MENNDFLKEQLITYLGNKRSLLNFIDVVVTLLKEDLKKDKLVILDGFSGSGCVARYMKQHSSKIMTNDLEKYSYIINKSFLRNKSEVDFDKLNGYVTQLNELKFRTDLGVGIIEKHYAPRDTNNPQLGERCFYTNENAKIIDNIRRTIDLIVPEQEYKEMLLSILLFEASVHTNTSGVFKGFYKGLQSPIGKFGGEKGNALTRIKGEITMEPIILSDYECESEIFQEDINTLISKLNDVDLVYYDPPYNQHPYGSNYHMLNTIIDYVEPQELSEVAGIPKKWNKSNYNKKAHALKSLDDLIQNTKSKYIMISYNNEGFITYDEMMDICMKKGFVAVYDETYSAFKASRNLKNRNTKVTEYIFTIKVL
jgi:adenine-specific DNA-methyltransferase